MHHGKMRSLPIHMNSAQRRFFYSVTSRRATKGKLSDIIYRFKTSLHKKDHELLKDEELTGNIRTSE